MNTTVADIVRSYAEKYQGDAFYFAPGIPPKKLKNAIHAYAAGLQEGDVFLLMDTTLFGSAKNGWLMTGDSLFAQLWNGLTGINRVRCYGPPPERSRTPTASFVVAGVASAEVARGLAQDGIFASNGNFYATTVVERLGHARDGLVRAGCACYTTEDEITRLVESVRRIVVAGSARC